MTTKPIVVATATSFAVSGVPFWLWKLFIVTGPAVRLLIWLFVALFGLGQFSGFILGAMMIFRDSQGWVSRAIFVVLLLGGEAYVSLMAALGMNFIGQ